mgnify:CR=1 FL=1|jgi:hypothetical protein
MDNGSGPRVLERVTVRPADVFGAGRAFPLGVQAAFLVLTLAALLGGVASVAVFFGAFWFLGEALRLAAGFETPLPLFLFLLPALLGAWCMLYLLTDRLAMLGSGRAKRVLMEKARAAFPSHDSPVEAFFVEARITGRKAAPRMDMDLGVLLLLPDRLVFVGDYWQAEVPRSALPGPNPLRRDRRSRFGVTPAQLTLKLAKGDGAAALRLLCRDDARLHSETSGPTRRLEAALRRWLRDGAGEPTYGAMSTQPPEAAER